MLTNTPKSVPSPLPHLSALHSRFSLKGTIDSTSTCSPRSLLSNVIGGIPYGGYGSLMLGNEYVLSLRRVNLELLECLSLDFKEYYLTRVTKKNGRYHKRKYKKAIDYLLAYLCIADAENKRLVTPYYKLNDVFKSSGIGRKVMQPIIEYFAKIGLIDLTVGHDNEFDHIATWCVPTSKLALIFHNYKIKVMIANDSSFVEIRAKKKEGQRKGELLPKPKAKKEAKEFDSLNQTVKQYNGFMTKQHVTTHDGKYLIPSCVRIFSNSSMSLGGRWYSRITNLLKDVRRSILINGSINAEPDFKAIHIFIAYSLLGEQYDLNDDPYLVEGYEDHRDLIKVLLLTLLNGAEIRKKIGQINKSAKLETKKEYELATQAIENYRSGKGKKPQPNYSFAKGKLINTRMFPDWLQGFIEDVPDGMNGEKIISAILAKHEPLKRLIEIDSPEYLTDIGLKLQFIDSQVMAKTLSMMIESNIAGLPIHDSVVCEDQHKYQVAEFMKTAYRSITGFEIVVSLD